MYVCVGWLIFCGIYCICIYIHSVTNIQNSDNTTGYTQWTKMVETIELIMYE